MTRTPLSPLAVAAVLAAALALPTAATAQGTAFIDGDPLNIYADGLGRFQVRHDAAPAGDLAPPESNAAGAGLNLAFYNANGAAGPVIGFLASEGTRGDAEFNRGRLPTRSGDGSARDPYVLTSTYQVPVRTGFTPTKVATVTERLRYVNGTTDVEAAYVITGPQDFQLRFRSSVVGDLYHLTSSDGSGFFQPGPPRNVGSVNLAAGAAGGLVEAPGAPWSAHEAGDVGTLFQKVRSPAGAGFDGSISTAFLNDATGVQWDNHRPPNPPLVGATAVAVTWRFPHFTGLALDPPSAIAAAGQTHQVQARFNSGGTVPLGGRGIRWEVTGANPTEGSAITDPSGNAAISWTGANAGDDALAAYVDLNGDGVRQSDEPQAIAKVEFQPPFGNPTRGVTFNVEPIRGKVLVAEEVPATGTARAATLTEFRELTSPAQVRIGSILNTVAGTVRMTMARDAAGTQTQSGDFSGGRFLVRQSEASPLTTVLLRGGNFRRCRRAARSHRSALAARHRRTIRRLRGSARGRFRTRGRHSSATVRGTGWITRDRCDGTLTTVTEGSVKVRDFKRRRTVVVKRGRSYLARARRR